MSALSNSTPVSPTEVARRLAEYRRLGFERRAPAQIVYKEPFIACPWPACGFRIDGIHFRLDQWLDRDERERLLDAWWRGPGLVGRCPKCDREVPFAIDAKFKVESAFALTAAVLPAKGKTESQVVTITTTRGESLLITGETAHEP